MSTCETDEAFSLRLYRVSLGRSVANQEPLRLPMISLTLFFSSLLPCLLHASLFVWFANENSDAGDSGSSTSSRIPSSKLVSVIIVHLSRLATHIFPTLTQEVRHSWQSLVSVMQREGIDEMWIVVRLLAGMSSGFGLRGMLPLPCKHQCH